MTTRTLTAALALAAAALPAAAAKPVAAKPPVRLTPEAQVELGRRLFERDWTRPVEEGSPLAASARGDGLGPLFNDVSCAACHRQGGVGGSGPKEDNAEILSLALPVGTPDVTARAAMRRAAAIHPAFATKPHVVLHTRGIDESGSDAAYAAFRHRLRSEFPPGPAPALENERQVGGLPVQLAQRNTPALFGAGLIDQVPPDFLVALANRQAVTTPETAGRAALDGAGRFGWRGQTTSLAAFVVEACGNELGLRVHDGARLHDQADWPLGKAQGRRGRPREDLARPQAEALVAFVRSLPPPREVAGEGDGESAARGRKLFERIGCADCHVPNLGPIRGAYGDLLLHPMGPKLADRVVSPSSPRVFQFTGTSGGSIRGSSSGGGGGSYGGGGSPASASISVTPPTLETTTVVVPPSLGELSLAPEEWRTPPLWGVADSAPYLHDGRAATLDEAIRLHGGQGLGSAGRYAGLDESERGDLLAFLGTLRAPAAE